MSPMTGNFVKCTARFDGSEHANVEAFLDNILTFKECTYVSDDNALRGLSIMSMLLNGTAATWWQGIKASTLNWTNAVQALKDSFSKKLPPYLIFREIFAREQNTDEQTELFVCKVRALLAQLPYTLSEEAELDMVYGLLQRKIRKRLPRNRFQTFQHLLKETRDIEASLLESKLSSDNEQTKSHPVRMQEPNQVKSEVRPKCTFCKNFGHLQADCRKYEKHLASQSKENKANVASKPSSAD
ncbi:activity-regulated cytoskeleton associated protein 2-like [Diabrotica virgifera virgifera]|uniref:Activity-regulated cytoskeleton associated protein 2-like n=1 Tax=Diabrotica virgifera virgifera TaxID=50390 RepID=A0A6P7HC43_DIAVI|nr:activity-regulated cytoskeleton associated protein 2-like [Diabrotica virgifera virgifera]